MAAISAAPSIQRVVRQIKALAAEEDTTVQELVAEALDLLFQARGKAAIARQ